MKTAEFIEEEFISEINTVLSHSGKRFRRLRIRRISQGKEGQRGFDGVINLKDVIHIQAKRGYYHDDTGRGRIESGRRKLGLSGEFYSFSLHKRNGGFKQHNKLWELHRNRAGSAIYVAPLFHTYDELEAFGNTYFRKPFHEIEYELFLDKGLAEEVTTMFLNKTMAICPHSEVVNGSTHHYAYDDRRVSFHSEPLNIPDGVNRGISWLNDRMEKAYNARNIETTVEILINRESPDWVDFHKYAKSIFGRDVSAAQGMQKQLMKTASDYIYSKYGILSYGIYA